MPVLEKHQTDAVELLGALSTRKMSVRMGVEQLLRRTLSYPFVVFYTFFQNILSRIFAPSPPPPSGDANLRRPRIAIIGAGLTGVSAAAHCVGHGFDVQIFEARSKEKGLGGIWSVWADNQQFSG